MSEKTNGKEKNSDRKIAERTSKARRHGRYYNPLDR